MACFGKYWWCVLGMILVYSVKDFMVVVLGGVYWLLWMCLVVGLCLFCGVYVGLVEPGV